MMFKFTKKFKSSNNKLLTKKNSRKEDLECEEESTVASESIHDNTNNKKVVRFDHKKDSYRHTISLKNMSNDEIESYWITQNEFIESKNSNAIIIRMMMKCSMMTKQQQLQETDEICCRGLEFRTKEGSKRRKRVKKKAVEAVLMEQELQRDEGIYDDKWLSEVYTEISGPNSIEALNRGINDHKSAIQGYVFDDDDDDVDVDPTTTTEYKFGLENNNKKQNQQQDNFILSPTTGQLRRIVLENPNDNNDTNNVRLPMISIWD